MNNIFAKIREPEDGFSQSSPLCCRPEAEELLAIAETLSGDNEKLNAGLDQWRQQVHALLAEPVVEDLSVEARLEALAMELRRRWITLAQSVVVADMKSPPVDYLPMLPASGGSALPVRAG